MTEEIEEIEEIMTNECNEEKSSDTMENDVFIEHKEHELFSIVENHDLVIIDFFAEWCMPCKIQSRLLDEGYKKIIAKYPQAKIMKYDTGNETEDTRYSSDIFQVEYIPTICVIYKKRAMKMRSTVQEIDNIIRFIDFCIQEFSNTHENNGRNKILHTFSKIGSIFKRKKTIDL